MKCNFLPKFIFPIISILFLCTFLITPAHSSLFSDNKEREGLLESFYSNGAVRTQRYYHKDKLHGESRLFDEEGHLMTIEKYVKGELEGVVETFYESGNKYIIKQYHKGHKQGNSREFDEVG
ncbi:MAG: antitoxin component YwqK of YwqJK toxin-antitoxin module, partial [Candidatus Omnitrophota bacterium]